MTKSQFEDSLRRTLVLDKLRAALTDWIAVSDSESRANTGAATKRRSSRSWRSRPTNFDRATVTDADVAAYFDSHKTDYRVGEQRKVKYLLLDREQARQRVAVPPNDIQRYYNDNIQQYPDSGTRMGESHPPEHRRQGRSSRPQQARNCWRRSRGR